MCVKVPLHRLPFQAETHHCPLQAHYCHHMGAGRVHHVPLRSHAAGHKGADGTDHRRQQKPHPPILLVQRKLAQSGDAEGLHHRPLR